MAGSIADTICQQCNRAYIEQVGHVCPALSPPIPYGGHAFSPYLSFPGVTRPYEKYNPSIRQFETGATRDTDTDKLDYEAFFSPAVLKRRAEFMHKNRQLPNGELRAGDNWQAGIPIKQYMKSLSRHYHDIWSEIREIKTAEGLEQAICAAMFNLEGMLYEILKEKQ